MVGGSSVDGSTLEESDIGLISKTNIELKF
jgi:hypothetical protein